jgi:hypothetical protein
MREGKSATRCALTPALSRREREYLRWRVRFAHAAIELGA